MDTPKAYRERGSMVAVALLALGLSVSACKPAPASTERPMVIIEPVPGQDNSGQKRDQQQARDTNRDGEGRTVQFRYKITTEVNGPASSCRPISEEILSAEFISGVPKVLGYAVEQAGGPYLCDVRRSFRVTGTPTYLD